MTTSIAPSIAVKPFLNGYQNHEIQRREVSMQKEQSKDDICRELLQQVAAKDTTALSSLYDDYAGILMSVILPVLKNKAEAEDILQDTFLTIWNKAEMYQPHLGKPTSWMITIAKNKAYDRYRKLVRTSEGMENLKESMAGNHDMKSGNPEGNDEALDSCFKKLNEDQQSAIGLVFYQGFTQQEASQKLESPLGTVKARIRRGLLQLKQCLAISNN